MVDIFGWIRINYNSSLASPEPSKSEILIMLIGPVENLMSQGLFNWVFSDYNPSKKKKKKTDLRDSLAAPGYTIPQGQSP